MQRLDRAAVLRGAAARARGLLYRLDLSGINFPTDIVLELLAANAGSLRELSLPLLPNGTVAVTLEPFVAAAPLLQVVEVQRLLCAWEEAPRVLRAEPPFERLRLAGELEVRFSRDGRPAGDTERVSPFLIALADVTLQPALSGVHLSYLDTAQPAVMAAVVNAALARRLRGLMFRRCSQPAVAPLAKLLKEGSIDHLRIQDTTVQEQVALFDAAGAALVAGALRVNTTLTSLGLFGSGLCRDMQAASTLLSALVGHPSLRVLMLSRENPPAADAGALSTALAALVAADAPALRSLDCSRSRLREADLATIVEALPRNRHLQELDIHGNDVSDPFWRVLWAILADHASLRKLNNRDLATTDISANDTRDPFERMLRLLLAPRT